MQNGEEVSRKLLQSVVTVQPVERVVAKGNTVNIPDDKQAVMVAAGISQGDFAYVDYIFSRESRWNAAATNAGGCAGLGQACPGAKVINACANWQTNAVCQTQFLADMPSVVTEAGALRTIFGSVTTGGRFHKPTDKTRRCITRVRRKDTGKISLHLSSSPTRTEYSY
ncbi:G5 domain-containing protein [Candidatus Saccharibacteria bacterium]|nr:MAG: G5 domain-containing protein [Candidatus Saccharibacteria bacterium]